MTRRKLLLAGVASAAGAAAASYGYGRLLERHWIQVARVQVPLGLAKPLKIAVAGDIHIDPLHEWEYTERWIGCKQGSGGPESTQKPTKE